MEVRVCLILKPHPSLCGAKPRLSVSHRPACPGGFTASHRNMDEISWEAFSATQTAATQMFIYTHVYSLQRQSGLWTSENYIINLDGREGVKKTGRKRRMEGRWPSPLLWLLVSTTMHQPLPSDLHTDTHITVLWGSTFSQQTPAGGSCWRGHALRLRVMAWVLVKLLKKVNIWMCKSQRQNLEETISPVFSLSRVRADGPPGTRVTSGRPRADWRWTGLKQASSVGQYQIKIGGEVDWPLTSTVQRILGTAVGMWPQGQDRLWEVTRSWIRLLSAGVHVCTLSFLFDKLSIIGHYRRSSATTQLVNNYNVWLKISVENGKTQIEYDTIRYVHLITKWWKI